ncbi:MAG: flavin oxidoreductase/NADH oxidase [Ruminococcaceae bacterium]|nr:flavin oxidoreductase/NADH oxidase [Oscillospiraceae bacterium]
MAYQVVQNKDALLEMCKEAGTSFPYSDDISPLSKEIKVGTKTVHNRIVYQAMEGCDGTYDGAPDELTKRRYLRFARGGAGIIWFEATAVLGEGRANPRQMYLTPKTKDDFKKIVSDIKEECIKTNGFEPIVICQLTHSGRYSKPEGTPAPLIAYNNPIFEKDNPIDKSRIVSDDYLDRVWEALVNGAVDAHECGFDGADIKSCHRYLLSEILSAYNRDGKYGGSFENRTRLLSGAIKDARIATPKDFIITSRLNIYDGFEYPYGFGTNEGEGITPDFTEAKMLVRKLVENGADMLDFTMGNPYFNPHVNRPYAKGGYEPPEHPLFGVQRMLDGISEVASEIKGTPVICSGISFLGGTSANVTAGYIKEGKFDFAGYGRETLAYPDVAKEITSGRNLDPKKLCICCGKCTEIMRCKGGTPGCVIRDTEVYAPLYKKFVLGKE